ncbi:MAG TPA: hypothetical protein VGM54_06985 [Chthoniobacter sp.]|jgi:hypothetical protein
MSPRIPDDRKTGTPEASGNGDGIGKPTPRTESKAASKLEVEHARKVTRFRGRPPGPTKFFHPAGRFRGESGSRFDYIFAELLEDPALPPWIFERVPFLLRGTNDRFQPRRATREEERIVVGLRYGYGDLPRALGRG